jgi:uncharacterized protein
VKFLLWALVLYLVWRWYQSTQNKIKRDAESDKAFQSSQSTEQTAAKTSAQTAAAELVEKMVSCSHCGIHVPLSEAVQSNSSSFFCSIEHQRQHMG